METKTESCPCGVAKDLATCCGPIIEGITPASSALALMRARYAAYTLKKVDFLIDSIHPESPGDVDRRSTEAWARSAEWHGLEILDTVDGTGDDKTGIVEFVAKFSLREQPQRHHERASFRRDDKGHWKYFDGDEILPQPVKGPRVKLTRNDPCPCDSGKKVKKCCGPVFDVGAPTPELLIRARFAAAITGRAEFLTESLHPDAPEPENEQADVIWRKLKVTKTRIDGEEAEVDYSFEEQRDGKSTTRRESTRLKRHAGRWLLLSSTSK